MSDAPGKAPLLRSGSDLPGLAMALVMVLGAIAFVGVVAFAVWLVGGGV